MLYQSAMVMILRIIQRPGGQVVCQLRPLTPNEEANGGKQRINTAPSDVKLALAGLLLVLNWMSADSGKTALFRWSD